MTHTDHNSPAAPPPLSPPADTRWRYALMAAIVFAIEAALLRWLPDSPPTFILGIAMAAFTVVVILLTIFSPIRRYITLAAACISIAGASSALPTIAAQLEWQDTASADIDIDSSPLVPMVAILAACFFAVLDFRMRHPTIAAALHSSDTPRAATCIAATLVAAAILLTADADSNITTLETAVGITSGQSSPGVVTGQVTYNQGGVEDSTLNRIFDRNDELVSLQRMLHVYELVEKDSRIEDLEEKLENARERLRTLANAGDEDAARALSNARETGDTEQIQKVLIEQADALDQQISESTEEFLELCREIAAVSYLRGDIEEAGRRVQAILGHAPDDLFATNQLGHIQQMRGEYSDAERSYRRVLALAGVDQAWTAVAYGNLGLLYQTRSDLDRAEEMLNKSLEISKKLGRLEGMANQYGNLGGVYEQRGEIKEARRLWIKARDLFEKIGMPHMVKRLQGLLDSLSPEDSGQ